MRKDWWAFFVLIFLFSLLPAQESVIKIHGMVFVDQNGNEKRDPEELAVKEAVISNQSELTLTDDTGTYTLSGSPEQQIIFISTPDGYWPVGSFWKRLSASSTDQIIDFPLKKIPQVTEFQFVHASDPHIQADSIVRMRKLRQVVAAMKPAFVLITGDLIHDALHVKEAEARKYNEMFLRETEAWPVPLFTVPGNHDIFGIDRKLSSVSPDHPLYGKKMYRYYHGPNYYSFTYGGIHFIGLDTVDISDTFYYGHVDPIQLEWLKKDIAATPRDQPLVPFYHIPFVTAAELLFAFMSNESDPPRITVEGKTVFRHSVSNAEEVLRELRKRPFPLALGGHMHLREALISEADGSKTRFHQAAAVLGPRAIGSYKTQSGITVYKVTDKVIDDGTFIQLNKRD